MAIYKRVFPTRYPLFRFYIQVWKLAIMCDLLTKPDERLSYEYVALMGRWGDKELFCFRLYDTYRRIEDRLDGMLTDGAKPTLGKLKEWRKIINEEIEKLS